MHKKPKHFSIIIAASLIFITLCGGKPNESKPTAIFERKFEPREKAFSLLVPKGWFIEGGAIRILDERYGGALNMVDCKFDLAVKSDKAGTVMIRWLPEMLCIDSSQAWGNPEGAVFNNVLVRAKRNPQRLVTEVIVPYAHPRARGVKVKEVKNLPSLASIFQSTVPKEMKFFTNMTYTAALVSINYEENGKRFDERVVTIIEDFGSGGGGLWKNRTTLLARAPEGEFPKWENILSIIQNSGDWNMKWVAGEIRGQMQRNSTIAATQQDLQRIDREISEGRRKTQEAIQRDMYLTLTDQNDYKNPFTGKVERDTASWRNRWVNETGNIIYSDDDNYDPNADPSLKLTGYQRTKGR